MSSDEKDGGEWRYSHLELACTWCYPWFPPCMKGCILEQHVFGLSCARPQSECSTSHLLKIELWSQWTAWFESAHSHDTGGLFSQASMSCVRNEKPKQGHRAGASVRLWRWLHKLPGRRPRGRSTTCSGDTPGLGICIWSPLQLFRAVLTWKLSLWTRTFNFIGVGSVII